MEKPDATVINAQTPILITGAGGFIGKNLAARLAAAGYDDLVLYDVNTPAGLLEDAAARAGMVYHLAGVNRPQNSEDFFTGNRDLTRQLLAALRAAGNLAPVVLSSTAQAGNGTDYGSSKLAAEEAVLAHSRECGAPVWVYRLPGVFGKWSRPNYNTVVATFCHNIARGLPIEVRDPAFSFPLCYIDDVVDSFMARMTPGAEPPPLATGTQDRYTIDPSYEVSLGWLAGTLRSFAKTRQSLALPRLDDALTRKLWATYLSFLPQDGYAYPLAMHADARGSFTEFLRTQEHGQVSVNVARPGVVKGNHWHDTKNEKFLVVKGRAVIRFRTLGSDDITEYAVSGDELQVVDIPPGTTHHIENVGDEDLVTVMWASQPFDADAPDTHPLPV